MAKIFISHSSKDKAFAIELKKWLDSRGHIAWLDTSELLVGDEIRATIDDGIGRCDAVAFVLSPDAIQSRWFNYELRVAQIPDGSGRKKLLLPVLLRECEHLPPDLEGIKCADFRRRHEQGWKDLEQGLSRWERMQQPSSTQEPVRKAEQPQHPSPASQTSRNNTQERELLASAPSGEGATDPLRQHLEAYSSGASDGSKRSEKRRPSSISATRVAVSVLLIISTLGLVTASNDNPPPFGDPASRPQSILLKITDALRGKLRTAGDSSTFPPPVNAINTSRSTRAVGGDTRSISELRNQHRVRPIQDNEVASSAERIPVGVLGFVEIEALRLLRRAPVRPNQSDTAFEVHKTLDDELLIVGYVGESEFAGAAAGKPFKISVAPKPNQWADRLISIPVERIKSTQSMRDNLGKPFAGLSLGSATPNQ
jgi:hypothetical protein